MAIADEHKLMRRVQGYHDLRLDGMGDLLHRARGSRVLDIGCNRGLVGFEFANNGAECVHGCDNYEDGIVTARHLFVDLRNVESRFEVVDLTKPDALGVFVNCRYDIIVMIATLHKIKRVMEPAVVVSLINDIANRTMKFFAWRATSDKRNENEEEMRLLDHELKGLKRVHTSYLSETLDVCAIWARR